MSSHNKTLVGVLQITKHTLIIVGIFSFFTNILMLTVPIYMMQLYDRVLTTRSYETLFYLSLMAVTALAILSILDFIRHRVAMYLSYIQDTTLGPEALAKCPDKILQGDRYGSQALRDLTTIRQFISGTGIFSLFDAPWAPIYLFVIFMLHPALGIVATIGAIILFSLAILNQKVTGKLQQEATDKALAAQQYADNSIRHSEAIQAMGMMNNLIRIWKGKNQEALAVQFKANEKNTILVTLSKFIRMNLQLLMLGVGGYYVLQNVLTGGAMIAASILSARALAPVEQAIGMWKQAQAAYNAYHRVTKLLDTDSPREAGISLPEPKGEVRIENLIYGVKTLDKPILSNISLNIYPGDLVAIIGPSGAGKSTLARLLIGAMKPNSGAVRLDSADVYTWDRDDFGKHVGYVPQDIELFTGTVKDNIARLTEEPDDNAVIQAAKLASLHEIILHLPDGYNTMLNMADFSISGGIRQRIALARALYKNPKLIVMDEPNSNLDSTGENALLNTLKTMREAGTTQIVITHHPVLLRDANKVAVLIEGKIQLYGPRNEVLEKMKQNKLKQGDRKV